MAPATDKTDMAALISGIAERIPVADTAHSINNMLEEVGPSCTRSASTFRDFLREIGRTNGSLDEASLASIIFFFSDKSDTPDTSSAGLSSAFLGSILQGRGQEVGNSGWDLRSVAQVLSEDFSNRDWAAVARSWDFPNFLLKDGKQFQVLLELYRAGSKSSPPLSAFTADWNNTSGQLSVIEAMMVVPPSVFIVPLDEEELADAATAVPTSQSSSVNPQCWASMDILQRLLQLSDVPSLFRRVRDLFIKGLLSCPEVLLCSMVRLQLTNIPNQNETNMPSGLQLKTDVMRELIPLFFKPNTHHRVLNGQAALQRMYKISPNTVTAACFEAWRSTANESNQRLASVVHIISIARLLPMPTEAIASLLNGSKDAEFSIAVAFVMADNDYLQLKPWLGEKLNSKTSALAFSVSLVTYLRKHCASAMPRGGQDGKTASLVTVENVVTSLQLLQSVDTSILGHAVGRGNHNETVTLGDNVKSIVDLMERMYPSLRGAMSPQNNPINPRESAQGKARGGSDLQGNGGRAPTSDDVEEKATQYFQKIYTGEQSINDFVAMLKKFKASSDTKENEIFACMVHNLFDEYRYFSRYPERELRITGILFGALIQEQLVSAITLGIALRYVLEALRKSPTTQGSATNGGKMFKFGMFALEQFKARLHEWPQYCSHIVQIPHLKEGYPALVAEVETEMVKGQSRAPSGSSQSVGSDAESKDSEGSSHHRQRNKEDGVGLTTPTLDAYGAPRVAVFGPNLGRAVTDETPDIDHESPTESVLDAVQFLVNNLSMKNVEQKAQELRELLEARYFGWFGHFLVVKRISTQPNQHPIYLTLLDLLGDYGKPLVATIITSAYQNIGQLLRSPKITTSTSERSYLKNLGIWLGQITLARNRPILQIMLDCKELLLQGYENGKLIAVAPFLAKTLEGAKNSVVFRPPNPWLMSILAVFRSVYDVEGLKMNIKFEVEVLCKNLGIRLDEIPNRSDVLARRIPPTKDKNPDFNIKASQQKNPPPVNRNIIGSPEVKSLGLSLGARGGGESAGGDQSTVIPNLASYVTLNKSLPQLLQTHAGPEFQGLSIAVLKRVVPLAVDRAIREIIQPVVERSVTIACITTKEIVAKDFAMESDETKVAKAGHLMVSNLAGSLALVTCREPLRSSMTTHLGQLVGNVVNRGEKFNDQEQKLLEQIIQLCVTDNLDLGCMLIEKAATEKAVRDVDEALKPIVSIRRNHREKTGQEYFDTSIFSNGSKYPSALPEQLRPAPGSLGPQHFQLYENFQKISRGSQSQVPASTGTSSRSSTPPSGIDVNSDAVSTKSISSNRSGIDALSTLSSNLESTISSLLATAGSRASEVKLSMLPPDHKICQILAAVKTVMPNSGPSGNITRPLTVSEEEAVLGFAQGILKRLYELKLSEPLKLESLVALLENVNVYCPKLRNDMGTWSTYAPANTDQERRLHRTILLLLVRSRLLLVRDLDTFLAARADDGRNHIWLEFSLLFIRTALLERIAAAADFPKLINLMHRLRDGTSQAPPEVAQSYRVHVVRILEETQGDRGFSASAIGSPGIKPGEALGASVSLRTRSSSLSQESLATFSGAARTVAEGIEGFSQRDPPNARQQVTALVEAWIRLQSDGIGNQNKSIQYLQALQSFGVGKVDEQTERFFRLGTLIVIEAALKSSLSGETVINYSFVDLYSNLLVLIFKHMNGGGPPEQTAAHRVSMLNKIVGVLVRTLMWDYERSSKRGGVPWDQRPWYRLFLNLISDINKPDPDLDLIKPTVVSIFAVAFHVCQPLVLPGFAFAWLDLISHRHFMPNALLLPKQQGWNLVHNLLIDHFLFLEPFLNKIELTPAVKKLYEGTLRVMLILLHDFPSFLAGYHVSFCNVIPETCVQLRNIILSATPKEVSPPDPFTPNLQIDNLPEIKMSPKILSPALSPIEPIREHIDALLKDGAGRTNPNNVLSLLKTDSSTDVNIPRTKALVLYLTVRSLNQMQNTKVTVTRKAELDVLESMMNLDDRNRYVVLSSIADELRYPSSHTHYLSCVMLYLFSESKSLAVKEQVTRVLLERLIGARPHPWGLLVTFIELIKNQRYQFWSYPFTRCATEIEKIFESVARSCLPPGTSTQRNNSALLVGGEDAP